METASQNASSQDCWRAGCSHSCQHSAPAAVDFRSATSNINAACCQARSNSDGANAELPVPDTSDEQRHHPAAASDGAERLPGASFEFEGENRTDTVEIDNGVSVPAKFAVDFNRPGGSSFNDNPPQAASTENDQPDGSAANRACLFGASPSRVKNMLRRDSSLGSSSVEMPESTAKDSQETKFKEGESDRNATGQSRSQWEIAPPQPPTSSPNPQTAEADEVERPRDLRNLTTRSLETLGTTTKDGHETEIEEDGGGKTGESSTSDEAGGSQESQGMRTEMDGQPISLPNRNMAGRGIWAPPQRTKKSRPTLVFGRISIMIQKVTEEALAIQLRSTVLKDMLENRERYRAIALRCGCELVFTRRVVVKRVVRWLRCAILLLRGPSEPALRRFRAQLEFVNPAFCAAVAYDAEKPRPRLLTSEHLPDNLELGVARERLGRAASGWERMPLAMPQRKYGKPLSGVAKTRMLLPNNGCIGQVLSYVYPQWGFQGSKPIPHGQTFTSAVEAAMELEQQHNQEIRKAALCTASTN